MTHDWLVAMNVDVHAPQGDGGRTLLGHRVLLILRTGPKSMRELHAATGRKVRAAELRAALAELRESGLVTVRVTASGARGGRPRESWDLHYPGSSAVRRAEQALAAASARRHKRHETGPHTPVTGDRHLAGNRRRACRQRRRRRLKPVPEDVADDVCDWICEGNYLRDYCRQPGTPSTRTIYNWIAKDPEFARRFRSAREFGEMMIAEQYLEVADSLSGITMVGNTIRSRREFRRRFLRPIDLRLQRWRRCPRRGPQGDDRST